MDVYDSYHCTGLCTLLSLQHCSVGAGRGAVCRGPVEGIGGPAGHCGGAFSRCPHSHGALQAVGQRAFCTAHLHASKLTNTACMVVMHAPKLLHLQPQLSRKPLLCDLLGVTETLLPKRLQQLLHVRTDSPDRWRPEPVADTVHVPVGVQASSAALCLLLLLCLQLQPRRRKMSRRSSKTTRTASSGGRALDSSCSVCICGRFCRTRMQVSRMLTEGSSDMCICASSVHKVLLLCIVASACSRL